MINSTQRYQTSYKQFSGTALGLNQLLAVLAGAPVLDALEQASTLIDIALKEALDVAMESDDHKAWVVVYMLEHVLALVNASIEGMLQIKQ